ncbi:MAG: response regulator [Pirellulaceae bacterium]|nr:response regulator [Pirellulaceae bacterium]
MAEFAKIDVLLVEDSSSDAFFVREALSEFGEFSLSRVERLADALDFLRENEPSIVLLDLGLPDSQGLETLTRFRRQAPELPVIVLTGRDDEELSIQTAQQGAHDYLVKSQLMGGNLRRTIRYVVERYQSAASLRESEERYRTLVDATASIVWSTPASGEFVAEQPSWSKFTGQTFEELKGWGWLNAVHPEDRAETSLAWRAAVASRAAYHVEHRLRRCDGNYRNMVVRAVPIIGSKAHVREWVGVHNDLTEQKLAEESLRLMNRAIESVTQGITIADARQVDCPLVYVSPGFERITGYSTGDCLGRNCRFLQGEKTDRSMVGKLRQAIQLAEACSVELLNYRKDGEPFVNEVSISPIRDAGGRLTHFVGVQTDVTERRSLEMQLRHAQKLDAFGQLAGGVAHDFNNLLTIINGACEFLEEHLTSEVARDFLGEISQAGKRAESLTRQLLAFSRKQVLAPRVLNLNTLIQEEVKLLRRIIGEDIVISVLLRPSAGAVKVDPSQIQQVLLNLAVNARDAMPSGGNLVIETRDCDDVEFPPGEKGGKRKAWTLLTVSDNGCGMSAEVQSRIFEPFFTTKQPGKGTGLGLATVFGIVKQSEGEIRVRSEIDRGTTFEIYSPRIDAVAEETNLGEAPSVLPKGTESVLIVEDEVGVRSLCARVLKECGYEVLQATDGEQALSLSAEFPGTIDLLVTDMVMPGLSGQSLAERLTQLRANIRTLFISGYTENEVIHHGVRQQQIKFLQKPFSAWEFAAKVRDALDCPATTGAGTEQR